MLTGRRAIKIAGSGSGDASAPAGPSFGGVPLKYLSLATLTVQNSLLTILLHYSRTSVSPDKAYSAASAVLLNELLKGSISTTIAFRNALRAGPAPQNATESEKLRLSGYVTPASLSGAGPSNRSVSAALATLKREVFSPDALKLSIPAALYVIQNNLQFVAASNLDVPTFQVTYNLKILTTALCSVLMLKRRLSGQKWIALVGLAVGVAIVQLQSTQAAGGGASTSSNGHEMNRFKGLVAVAAACTTSGLAGVYFELVLKGSKTDLWIRNVQLSLFSLIPALCPVYFPNLSLFSPGTTSSSSSMAAATQGGIFANFGFWAWSVVLCQVLGGLVTALVIKYSDNILKGFATSLAIIISFVAGIVLFDFQATLSFFVGATVVIGATYLYNLPDRPKTRSMASLVTPRKAGPPPMSSSVTSSLRGGGASPSTYNSPASSTYFGRGMTTAKNSSSSPSSSSAAKRETTGHARDPARTPEVNLNMPTFKSTSSNATNGVDTLVVNGGDNGLARSHSTKVTNGLGNHSQRQDQDRSVSSSPVLDYSSTDGVTMVEDS